MMEAIGRIYAAQGATLLLAARGAEKLKAQATDMQARGAHNVFVRDLDLTDHDAVKNLIAWAFDPSHIPEIAIVGHGLLPDQEACRNCNESEVEKALAVNFTSYVQILSLI